MKRVYISLLVTLFALAASSQQRPFSSGDIFQTHYFIENKGQFEKMQSHVQKVDFALLHHNDEVYINEGGLSFHLISKEKQESDKGEKEKEKSDVDQYRYSWVDLQWRGINVQSKALTSNKTKHYFVYGEEKYISYGYEKITYPDLYPGIDVVYELHPKGGIEYSLIVQPYADLSKVRLSYSGNKETSVQVYSDKIVIRNQYHQLAETGIRAYYENGEPVEVNYVQLPNHEIGFRSLTPLKKGKTLIIDPWVSAITSLVGSTTTVANVGFDVDFDIYGNLFVMGGGGGTNSAINAPHMAKYDALGVLQWTFPGNIVTPAWNASPSAPRSGNIAVDKISSKVYMSQGGNFGGSGASVVRLKNTGVYDGFMSVANMIMNEIWEMKFNCNNGNCMAIGGGTSSNINFGLIDTTTGLVTTSNVTGAFGPGQDIVCAALDDNGDVYVIFAGNTATANKIYKLNSSYTSYIWNTPSGYNTMTEQGNKPFTLLPSFSNSFNCLAANNVYVFYYDGVNLKAFNKTTGASVGTPFVVPSIGSKMQGGIYANNCNEVYVGGNNGNLYRYGFNGSTFTIQDTIIFPGYTNKAVYDINFNPLNNLLYVSGNGFVATADPATTCVIPSSGSILLSSATFCPDSAIVTVTNPDSTGNYTYIWTDSTTNTALGSSSQGVGVFTNGFSGLIQGHTITVTVNKSSSCQVQTSSISFVMPPCNSTQLQIDLCPGQTYTSPNGNILSATGVYHDTLLSSQGLDSIVSIYLTMHNDYHDTVVASICQGQTYTLPGGTSVTVSGSFTDSLNSTANCDSVITTILTVYPTYNASTSATICGNQTYTLPGGTVVNSSGNYHDTLQTTHSCDSVIHTSLTVNPSHQEIIYDSICSDQTYTLPSGVIVSQSGTYSHTFINQYNCDSVITVNLTVHPATLKTEDRSICQGGSYTLPNGLPVSTSGTYSSNFISVNGCDSIILTTLTVVQSTSSNQEITICSDQQHQLPNGTQVSLAGNYTTILQNTIGCDSIISTKVNVVTKPALNLGKDTVLCGDASLLIDITTPNATYLWNDMSTDAVKIIQAPGLYFAQLTLSPCSPVIDSIRINVCDCQVFLPNAFSPNGDGKNDSFKPVFKCYTDPENYIFKIYNRWGQELFSTSILNDGWDGQYKQVDQNSDTYMYFVRYVNPISKQEVLKKGDLTLLR